jgi:hypothetical protein
MGFLRLSTPSNIVPPGTTTALPLLGNIVSRFSADSMALANGANVTTWTDAVGGIVAGTTIGTAPTFQTNRLNSKPSVKFTGGGLSIATPGALRTAIDSQECTVFCVFRNQAASGYGQLIGSHVAGDSFGLFSDGTNVGRLNRFVIPYAGQSAFSTIGNTSFNTTPNYSNSGDYQAFYINGCSVFNQSDLMPATGGNAICLGTNAANGAPVNAEIFDIVVWNKPLTPAQMMQAHMWAADKYAQTYPWAAVAAINTFFGDSITAGVGVSGAGTPDVTKTAPWIAAQTLGLTLGQWHNAAVGGIALDNLNVLAPTWVDPIPALTGKNQNIITFEWANQRDSTTTKGAIYLAARKAVSGNKTVWGTSTSGSAYDPSADRATFNTAWNTIGTGAKTNIDSYMPIHTDTHIGVNGSYATYSSGGDGIHLTDTTYPYLAALFVTGINGVPGAASFRGNPNVTITGPIAGSIVTSRDSDGSTYQTPFFIQVSASGITATGTSAPYEDLEYSWNFGDASSAETFTRPTDGVVVNSNSSQTGPEAAHVYRNSGSYTITLSIRGRNGASFTTATVTKNITVNAFATGSNEMWFDSVGGADANPGTLASPKQTISAITTALLTSGKKIWLKRNSHWTGSAGMKFSDGTGDIVGIRVDAYGSGAIPIIEVSSGAEHACQITTGGSSSATSKLDIVVSNCHFLNSGANNHAALSIGSGGDDTFGRVHLCKNVYLDSCIFETTFNGHTGVVPVVSCSLGKPEDETATNWGWWKCDVLNPTTTTTITQGIGGSCKHWLFHFGGTIRGAGESADGDHHLYNDCKTHSHYRWINFGQTGTGQFKRNFCINGNWDETEIWVLGHGDARYHCYSENSFRYTSWAFDLGNRAGNEEPLDSTDLFTGVVVEGNALIGLNGSLFPCGKSVTQRFNRMWGGGQQLHGPTDSPGQIPSVAQKTHLLDKIYSNRLHIPSTAATGGAIIVKAASGWTSPMFFTDNIIADFRGSGVGAFLMYFSDQASAGSVIDRNNIHTPNNLSQMATDQAAGGTTLTYAQYRARPGSPDVNSVNTNNSPGWATTVSAWADLN